MFLRYEDFAARPCEAIDEILSFVGERDAANPIVNDDTVPVSTTHTVEGNVTRFASGEIVIRLDAEWQRKMSRGSKALVTAMTWPLLWRYGYLRNR